MSKIKNPWITSSSTGESRISRYLEGYGVEFVKDKQFATYFDHVDSDVKTKRPDFIILTDGQPTAVIEFDGIQHFRYNAWFHGDKAAYMRSIAADDKKTRLMEKRRIPLLRIRYDQEDKIERILQRFLKSPGRFIGVHNPYLSNKRYYEDREAA